ncbi:hypothetical protein LMH87_002898 [Akanthomyces muscarius]|uniref:RING-type domain-containing protein n=1 Tax=Akanthomyces muscarius TaxID=2231603 RepID=A0A9W8Q8L8_AKAMU|nr:hypothetical protein LMH87_002898 [Akanthomyces muscarius]KAJ4148429.1 hypothetical protein LMH87_002898 [Akanthomyces muscarius]
MAPISNGLQAQLRSAVTADTTHGRSPSSTLTTVFPAHVTVRSMARAILQRFIVDRVSSSSAAPPPQPQQPGRLTRQDVEAMSVIEYVSSIPSPPLKGQDLDTSYQGHAACAICTEKLVTGAVLRRLHCRHQFHAKCIDLWLLEHSGTCPLCRANLAELAQPAKSRRNMLPRLPRMLRVRADENPRESRQDSRALSVWRAQMLEMTRIQTVQSPGPGTAWEGTIPRVSLPDLSTLAPTCS